jgi:hypothetical protein
MRPFSFFSSTDLGPHSMFNNDRSIDTWPPKLVRSRIVSVDEGAIRQSVGTQGCIMILL